MPAKCQINSCCFDDIQTEKQAYFLGLLYADGYNNTKRNVVRLKLIDEDVIIAFRDFVETDHKVYKYIPRGNIKPVFCLEFCDQHISRTLEELGCGNNKSFTLVFPTWIDYTLVQHFIRGYFDGDGCIYFSNKKARLNIVSTLEFCLSLQQCFKQLLNINSFIVSKKHWKNNTRALEIYGNKQIFRFLQWIYDDATVCIKRKFDKYLELVNYYGQQ